MAVLSRVVDVSVGCVGNSGNTCVKLTLLWSRNWGD